MSRYRREFLKAAAALVAAAEAQQSRIACAGSSEIDHVGKMVEAISAERPARRRIGDSYTARHRPIRSYWNFHVPAIE